MLMKTIRMETGDDSLFSKSAPLLSAATELAYHTVSCSALNAEELRRENGIQVRHLTVLFLKQSATSLPNFEVQLTLVISNSMGPWKKFESTVIRLKRSYENTGSVVCLTTKGRQLEQNFEELKPASHVSIL